MKEKITRNVDTIFFDVIEDKLFFQSLLAGFPQCVYNKLDPEAIKKRHSEGVFCGANAVVTNTFDAKSCLLEPKGYEAKEIVKSGVALAKSAGANYIAFGVGPLDFRNSIYTVDQFDFLFSVFRKQVYEGNQAGIDCVFLHGFPTAMEAKIAIMASKRETKAPIFVTLNEACVRRHFEEGTLKNVAMTLEGHGAQGVGAILDWDGPKSTQIFKEMEQASENFPLLYVNNLDEKVSRENYKDKISSIVKNIKSPVSILGGDWREEKEILLSIKSHLKTTQKYKDTKFFKASPCSGKQIAWLNKEPLFVSVSVNPTSGVTMKRLFQEKREQEIVEKILCQMENGIQAVNINLGPKQNQDKSFCEKLICALNQSQGPPVQMDNFRYDLLERTFQLYEGLPIVNSVCAKMNCAEKLFALGKDYGAFYVLMPIDEKGIPKTAKERVKIVEKLMRQAKQFGIDSHRLIADCLVLPSPQGGHEETVTLKTGEYIKKELGLRTLFGIDNISYGQPFRKKRSEHFMKRVLKMEGDVLMVNPSFPFVKAEIQKREILKSKV